MPAITIDKNHIYYKGGVKINALSITQVIKQWVYTDIRGGYYVNTDNGTYIKADVFQNAGSFGTEIHRMIANILGGGGYRFDELRAELRHSINQFMAWRDMYLDTSRDMIVEQPMYSDKFIFCGMPDLIGYHKLTGQLMIVEFKTTAVKSNLVGIQTAAQRQLCVEYMGLRDNAKIDRYVLGLPNSTAKENSRYSFNLLEGKNDWDYFRSALYCKAWLNN